ncbi:hypothetical protein HB818_03690 [Listeria booriae]|uniref:TcpE family conjugal transfer membrane protein n=1 Tax=Listeria booriae TaxID=1552123 RepID=UPI0016278485|nr:TcpE family conjugal transfer membrane protein [Listeria booriae]MBC1284866.1 hypothetical protein [Listeria booriae]
MGKETFNYKEVFNHPIMIHQLTDKFVLPFGVSLARIVTFTVIFLIMLIFRDFFTAIGSFMAGLTILLYGVIPYFVSGWLLKLDVNGKKLHLFMWDLMRFVIAHKIQKKVYANDEPVKYLDKKQIRFEKFVRKERK